MKIRTRKGIGAQLARAMNIAIPAEFYDEYTQPKINKGDFVSVFDSLCEVVSSTKSEFGYKSFKLKYLTRPPIPEHKEDCYPAISVRKQIDGQKLRQGVLSLLTSQGQKLRLDNRHLRKAMRESALRTWNEWTAAQRARYMKTQNPAPSSSEATASRRRVRKRS
jgi:hypothetical protein